MSPSDADQRLDLVGIGMLFALSHRAPVNALACIRYGAEFGSANVFNIRIADTAERATKPAGRTLFKDGVTLEKLEELIVKEGFEIRHTRLTGEFDFQQMAEMQSEDSILLYAVSPDGAVFPFANDRTFKAGKGWRIAQLDKTESDVPDEKAKSAGERAKAHISEQIPKPLPG